MTTVNVHQLPSTRTAACCQLQQSQSQQSQRSQGSNKDKSSATMIYKATVSLAEQQLTADGEAYKLVPGMQVIAEINQGKRTVLEFLLSPIEKTLRESGHER
jgi:HlyD family secretion protein